MLDGNQEIVLSTADETDNMSVKTDASNKRFGLMTNLLEQKIGQLSI